MSDRYLPNPALSTTEPETIVTNNNKVSIRADLQRSFHEKAVEILDNLLRNGFDKSRTGGYAVALLWYYLEWKRWSNNGTDKNCLLDGRKAETYLKGSERFVETALRRCKGRRVTLLCGDAGPLAVGCVVFALRGNGDRSAECAEKLRNLWPLVERTDDNEILYGKAGYLSALLFVRQFIGLHVDRWTSLGETLHRRIVDALSEQFIVQLFRLKALDWSEKKSLKRSCDKTCKVVYEWHGKRYYGAAHGLAGIFYVLLCVGRRINDQLEQFVKPALKWAVRQKYAESDNFLSSEGSTTDRLVHWCHGSPGWMATVLKAGQLFGDDRFLDEAKLAEQVIWRRGLLRKGPGLCHGIAGNGYAFLSLYRATGSLDSLRHAVAFAEFCLKHANQLHTPDRPYSLYEGTAGLCCFLIDLLRPESSGFPAYEMDSLSL